MLSKSSTGAVTRLLPGALDPAHVSHVQVYKAPMAHRENWEEPKDEARLVSRGAGVRLGMDYRKC